MATVRREAVMKRWGLAIALCLLAASTASAQTKTPLEGVWKIAEWIFPDTSPFVKPGAPSTISNPEPSLIIFTRQYYSRLNVEEPRSTVARPKDPQKQTDAEKIALYEQWRPFTASAGTYEIRGSTLILVSIVAKNVAVMSRSAPTNWDIKLESPTTIWLIPSPDRIASEPRMKLVRLGWHTDAPHLPSIDPHVNPFLPGIYRQPVGSYGTDQSLGWPAFRNALSRRDRVPISRQLASHRVRKVGRQFDVTRDHEEAFLDRGRCGRFPSLCAGRELQVLVDHVDRDGPFAHRGRQTFDRSGAHIAGREHAGQTGLEAHRLAVAELLAGARS